MELEGYKSWTASLVLAGEKSGPSRNFFSMNLTVCDWGFMTGVAVGNAIIYSSRGILFGPPEDVEGSVHLLF